MQNAIDSSFDAKPIPARDLAPQPNGAPLEFGYIDGDDREPTRLSLRDQTEADRVLADKPPPYRRLDTAFLEALILRDALGLTEDDIANQNGVTYAKSADEAIAVVENGQADAAFLLRPTPIEQVREVAQAGVPMPPKSTFFFPKVPTGLLFNPLE